MGRRRKTLTQGDQFLSAVHPIFKPPQAPAGWCDQQEQTAFVEGLIGPVARLRVANPCFTE